MSSRPHCPRVSHGTPARAGAAARRTAAAVLGAALVAPVAPAATGPSSERASQRLPADPVVRQVVVDAARSPLPELFLLPADPPSSTGDVESYEGYDASYIFGLTRSVARSTMVTPVKPLLFIFTIPLDLVLLPFAAIGGFFS